VVYNLIDVRGNKNPMDAGNTHRGRLIQAVSLNAVLANSILANPPGPSERKGFAMFCPVCGNRGMGYGRNRNGTRRFRCRECLITFSEERQQEPRVFEDRQLSMQKAATAIRVMMEGTSVSGTCRLLHLGKATLLDLLLQVGQGCERLMEETIVSVPCESIQCDELWSFIAMKEKTKIRKGYHWEEIGDCYTWTAIEKTTKLLLAYAVGRRDNATAMEFMRKLRRATPTFGSFQIDTDGLGIYTSVIPILFGRSQDHAQVIKIFGFPAEGETKYSPGPIIDMHVQVGSGNPDVTTASTSFVERSNLTIRMMLRRFTRLTNGFSKSWRYHKAALGLLFAFYNFCRKHMTLTEQYERKTTPAMAAELTDHVWSVKELIERVIPQDMSAVA